MAKPKSFFDNVSPSEYLEQLRAVLNTIKITKCKKLHLDLVVDGAGVVYHKWHLFTYLDGTQREVGHYAGAAGTTKRNSNRVGVMQRGDGHVQNIRGRNITLGCGASFILTQENLRDCVQIDTFFDVVKGGIPHGQELVKAEAAYNATLHRKYRKFPGLVVTNC
jgi:hypothetical protein